MRVIGGKYGSRPLRSLRGLELRPTSDRLRETLFNILGPTIAQSVFVDLYAGTGAVGIEALSRGADEVVFVEEHAAAVKLIRENLRSLGIALPGDREGQPQLLEPTQAAAEESAATMVEFPGDDARVEVLATDCLRALALLHQRKVLADFIFVDPPYEDVREYERTLGALSSGHLLAPTGRVIVEAARLAKRPPARREAANRGEAKGRRIALLPGSLWWPPERIGSLEQTRIVEQGDSLLVFYRLALAA